MRQVMSGIVFFFYYSSICRCHSLTYGGLSAFVCTGLQQHSAGDIMIRNIQLGHAGKYTCAVQTKVDSISIAVDLVVRGKS